MLEIIGLLIIVAIFIVPLFIMKPRCPKCNGVLKVVGEWAGKEDYYCYRCKKTYFI